MKNRKIIIFLVIMILCVLFAGCSEKTDTETQSSSVSVGTVSDGAKTDDGIELPDEVFSDEDENTSEKSTESTVSGGANQAVKDNSVSDGEKTDSSKTGETSDKKTDTENKTDDENKKTESGTDSTVSDKIEDIFDSNKTIELPTDVW